VSVGGTVTTGAAPQMNPARNHSAPRIQGDYRLAIAGIDPNNRSMNGTLKMAVRASAQNHTRKTGHDVRGRIMAEAPAMAIAGAVPKSRPF